MQNTYITSQGDTFDLIAKKIYGKEKYFVEILNANKTYSNTVIFSSGVELVLPEINTVEDITLSSAPWR